VHVGYLNADGDYAEQHRAHIERHAEPDHDAAPPLPTANGGPGHEIRRGVKVWRGPRGFADERRGLCEEWLRIDAGAALAGTP
jgi:hypothetical protein